MSAEIIVIICLMVVIVFQNWFYLKQIQKLVDKVMSGSYATYTQGQAFVNESLKSQQPTGFNVQLPQQEEMDELAQLNAMIKPPF